MEPRVRVVLYTKPGCGLCEEMKTEINGAGCDELFELEEVNIECDPELFDQYCYDIPVLTISGVEAFRHRLTAEEFRARVYLASNQSQ